jgi:hypothetical protein
MRRIRVISLVVAAIAVCSPVQTRAGAGPRQSPPSSGATCIALPLPSLRGAEGSSTEVATSVRDLVSTYLTGPSLRTVALDARLTDQAIEEARQKTCGSLLTITLTRKRSSGGGFGRVLGEAAGAAAWQLPYGANATASVARRAAIAGSTAVSSMASNTRAKDELQLEYRLMSDAQTVLRDGKDAAKAKADGEDLLTPLVERMATIVASVKDKS